MKKRQSYLVLLSVLLLCGTMQAKVNNYVGLYADAGEWTLLPSSDSKYKASLGAAGGVGFMYELQAGKTYSPTRFLFDVGLGAHGGTTIFKQTGIMTIPLEDQKDLQGDNFTYMYELKNRQDQYTNVAVEVPLMVGVQYSKFYMLAGVKLRTSVMTRANTKAILNTYGLYEEFDEFRNMPEYQFFSDRQLNSPSKAVFDLSMDASFEIGGRIGVLSESVGFDVPKQTVEYRLAAFADYGLLDIRKRGLLQNEPISLPKDFSYDTNPASPDYVYNSTSMVDNLTVNNIIFTEGFAQAVHSVTIGVKFTVLFQLPEPKQCVLCHDSYRSLAHPRNGRLKYEE